MNWRTTAVTIPGWIDDANLPSDLNELDGFEHYARDAALDIETFGAVDLQRVAPDGHWESFEVATDTATQVMVANRPAIRFVPVDGCNFRLRWKQ